LGDVDIRMTYSLEGKRVLLTGATGFIGSHLARRLLQEGAEIHVLVRKESNRSRIRDILSNLLLWKGDINDYESIRLCIRNTKPNIIFHLASMRNVERDPSLINSMIETHIKGTLNLVKAVIDEKIPIECFINTGSSEEYGDGSAPFHESQREMPVSPYSASKVAATYFCEMMHRAMGLPVITIRPFLTYGPYQDIDMFIPSLIHHCLARKDFQMTEGDQTREFNYVDDVIDAYLLTAVRENAIGQTINIGNGIEYRIRDVAEHVVKMMGSPIRLLIGVLPKRPGETPHHFCNNEKAKRLLGWSPKVSLDDGLKKTIDWYRKYLNESPAEI